MGVFANIAQQQKEPTNVFSQASIDAVNNTSGNLVPIGQPGYVASRVNALKSISDKVLPTAGAIGGGLLGGTLGGFAASPTIAGIPAGVIAGGIAGAGLGAAGGTALNEKIQGKTLNPKEIAKSGVTSAAIEAASGGIGLGVKAAAKAPLTAKLLGKMTGYAQDVLDTALQRTPGAINALKNGESALVDTVKDTSTRLSKYAQNLVDTTKQTVSDLSKLSGGGKGYPGTRQAILQKGKDFIGGITNSLRSDFNIGVTGNGILNFARSSMPSNIVSGGDKGAIQDAFNVVRNIGNDTSIKNIDSVLERLITLKSKTPVGTPTGAETRKIIAGMMNNVVGFVKSLGDVSPAYTKYASFLEENLPRRAFVNDAKEVFSGTENLSAKEISLISSRLLNVFKTGRQASKDFAGQVGQRLGTDPLGSAAGTIVKSGDKISLNPATVSPRGVASKIVEALPRVLVQNFIKTGNIAALELHPIVQATARAAGVATKDIAQWIGQSLSKDN